MLYDPSIILYASTVDNSRRIFAWAQSNRKKKKNNRWATNQEKFVNFNLLINIDDEDKLLRTY